MSLICIYLCEAVYNQWTGLYWTCVTAKFTARLVRSSNKVVVCLANKVLHYNAWTHYSLTWGVSTDTFSPLTSKRLVPRLLKPGNSPQIVYYKHSSARLDCSLAGQVFSTLVSSQNWLLDTLCRALTERIEGMGQLKYTPYTCILHILGLCGTIKLHLAPG